MDRTYRCVPIVPEPRPGQRRWAPALLALALAFAAPGLAASVAPAAPAPAAASSPAAAGPSTASPSTASPSTGGPSTAELAAASARIRALAAQDPTGASLESLLAGEFALQSGKLGEAAQAYQQAARAAKDLVLAERATSIAIVARQDEVAAQSLELWRRLGGRGEEFDVAEATLALRRGNERAALRGLNKMMAAQPDTGWRQVLTVLSAGAKDQDQAGRVLARVVDGGKLPQDNLMAWVAFGGLAQRLDQRELTERIVEEVVRRFPGEPRVAVLRATQLREDGKPEQAREVLASLLPKVEGDASLRALVAEQYEALHDYKAVAEVFARGPQDERTYALRASYLVRAEDKPTLTRLYQELQSGAARPDPARRLLLGQLAEYLERHEDALAWYQGVPGGEQREIARLRAASVQHKLGRREQAVSALRAIQSDASVQDDSRRDAYLVEAGLHAEDKADAAETDAYARGLAAFPDDAEVLYARALSWERRDDIARAEADLRRILVAEPDSVGALNALGYTLADRTDRYQEALELIQRALAAEPESPAIIDSYGWVLYRLGRVREAEVELRRALTLQKDAEIAAHLAEVLWESGRRDEARKYFDQARKIEADNRSLLRALKKYGL